MSTRNRRNSNLPSTISYFTNSFGLYFGPYFIMNRNERVPNTRARNLINEQVQNNIMSGTGLMWSDLLEAIENGVITEQELSDFGIEFGQTPISEHDAPITIQSLVNLHKHSLKLTKVKYNESQIKRNNIYNMPSENLKFDMNNNTMTMTDKKDECVIQIDNSSPENNQNSNPNSSKDCRVSLEFEYDSYTPCQVHLFWNAREVIVKNGNERKAIYLLNHNENRNSMTIGPLPAGTNQKFVLPGVIDIPASAVDSIVKQTNENSLEIAKSNVPKEGEIRNSENDLENTENTVDVNESNASTSNAPNNNNNEPTNDPNNNSRIRSIFNHSRRSSNVSRRSSKHSTKKEPKERRIIWYPLIIVLEALEKKDEKNNDHAIKYQTTFLKLDLTSESNQYHVKSVDQKVMIKNNLYRLQEIYGFTDVNDAENQVVTNEVNSSIECVICLSEPRNTVVLPCRHLCVCQDCADILCNQSRQDQRSSYMSTPRCPICRQIFHSFLRINMDYFNLEDGYEKSGKQVDDIAAAKGKKGNVDSAAPKKFDIIATSCLNDDELDTQLNKSVFEDNGGSGKKSENVNVNQNQNECEITEKEEKIRTEEQEPQEGPSTTNLSNAVEPSAVEPSESNDITETTEIPKEAVVENTVESQNNSVKEEQEYYEVDNTLMNNNDSDNNNNNSQNINTSTNDINNDGGPNTKKSIYQWIL